MAPGPTDQFGEYTVAEIARHVADLRPASPSRLRHLGPMWHRLVSPLRSRLHIHGASRPVEPARRHTVPASG